MKTRILVSAVLAVALPLLAGCAGGWRNGPPPGEADSAPPIASSTGLTGTTFVYQGEGQSVNVAGDFNEWNTSADPMEKQADGSWNKK